jgi:hypothetical protein
MKQLCSFSLLVFSIVLKSLARAIKQGKEIKIIHIRKKEVKLSLFANDLILYLKDCEDPMKKLLHLINTFGNVARYKINIQKSVAFLCTINEQQKKDIRKIISLIRPSKNKNTKAKT